MFAAIFVVIVVGVVAFIIWRVIRQRSELKPVITEFMEAGVARNVEKAYACCSHYSPSKEDIVDLIKSSYDVFAGYERFTIKNHASESGGGTTETYVNGRIIYAGGKKLAYECSLMKEDGVWKIAGIQIGSNKKGIVRTLSRGYSGGGWGGWGR
jgi:hypothetical protein